MSSYLTATAVLGYALAAANPADAQQSGPLSTDPEVYCTYPADQRLSLAVDAVRSAWYDLDVHGRATIGSNIPLSTTFGASPLPERDPMRAQMEGFKNRLQHLMALTGRLFPHYERASDGNQLIERFITRSVPIYGTAAEHQIAVMEGFLAHDEANRDRGIAFIAALQALEDSALAVSAGNTAPAFNDEHITLHRSFHEFMPALKAALFSPDFETALGRRLAPYCEQVLAELERGQE